MKRFFSLLTIPTMLWLSSCASGPGQASDEAGAAGLSLQLAGLEDGTVYVSNDGYVLEFRHFAMAFSSMRVGDESVVENFSADFFDEEVVDIVELEDIPPGEYDSVELVMGAAGSGGNVRFLRARQLKNAETTPGALDGNSVYLEAEASKGGDNCVLQVALQVDGETMNVDSDGNDIDIVAGEETEILVEVDPNQVFSGIDLAGLCTGGATVTISSQEDDSLAQQIGENLAGAFTLGSTEGHSHSHGGHSH